MARTCSWIAIVAALGLTACVNLRVETRYEEGFDFSALRRFAFVEPGTPAFAPGDPVDLEGANPPIAAALERGLAAKGYQRAARDEADFLVYFQAGTSCNAGFVTGWLHCSTKPGPPLGLSNCPMVGKSKFYYVTSATQCPQ